MDMDENTQQILESIAALTEARDYHGILKLLTKHMDMLQGQLSPSELLALLEAFPLELPVWLLYLKGQLLGQLGHNKEACHTFHHTKVVALRQQMFTQAINCCLELTTLYQQRGDFQTALYHIQEAENISTTIVDQTAKARLLLSLAELCPDIGQLEQSIQYARDAYRIYSITSDYEGQFKALYLLAIVNRQLGNYSEAASRLEMARQCQLAAGLSTTYYARILSAEAHLFWYQGRLREAISKARIFNRIADINNLFKQRVYAHLLLGNLYRALGQYIEAGQWYTEAEMLTSYYDLPVYLHWVEIQKGWLKILTGDLPQARRHIHMALQTDNKGLRMSFNVNLACLELLEGHLQSAQKLFLSSRQYYARSGDLLSFHIIGLYLAYLHRQTEPSKAIDYLQQALEWFTTQNILYFPIWWHPPMMAEICVFALAEKICTPLAERIFLTHLQEYGHLLQLNQYPDTAVRQRVLNLQQSLTNHTTDILAEVTNPTVKSILQKLLENGPLCPDKFYHLQKKLSTAKHRHKLNPTCIAVFGLYLEGFTRQQIAKKLDCSPATIRNYITIIYQVFHLQPELGKGTLARKEELRQLAQVEGFVREKS